MGDALSASGKMPPKGGFFSPAERSKAPAGFAREIRKARLASRAEVEEPDAEPAR